MQEDLLWLKRSTMLRIAGRRLASQACLVRPFSTSSAKLADDASTDKGSKAFLEKFMPNLTGNATQPQFLSDFVKKPEELKDGVPEKLTLNFYLPHKQEVKNSKVCFS
jgi:hypothetical protein